MESFQKSLRTSHMTHRIEYGVNNFKILLMKQIMDVFVTLNLLTCYIISKIVVTNKFLTICDILASEDV